MNHLKILLATIILAGCATTPPLSDAGYTQYGSFVGALQRCFQGGLIEPRLHAEATRAVNMGLNTWQYDRERLVKLFDTVYQNTEANTQTCRPVESTAHRIIADMNQRNGQMQQASRDTSTALQNFNAQMPKTIWCNRIGTMTMCN